MVVSPPHQADLSDGCRLKKRGRVQVDSADFPDGLRHAYPSAYHPPPLSSKEKREMIFLALLRQQGQKMVSVPIETKRSVTVPFGHSNS
jgi:hypothetical protein